MDKETLLSRFVLTPSSPYDKLSLLRAKQHNLNVDNLRKAAVLIPCVVRASGINVILTKRALHLRHHPGQISFPGGSYEQSDDTLLTTAIRETEEEIGISSQHIEVIGTLPTLPTISGFIVTPYLGLISSQYKTQIDHQEVMDVFEVPGQHLLNPSNLIQQQFYTNGSTHNIYSISYNEHAIWGATAQIIRSLQQQVWHE